MATYRYVEKTVGGDREINIPDDAVGIDIDKSSYSVPGRGVEHTVYVRYLEPVEDE